MANGPEPEEPPEFQRGQTTSSFRSTIISTDYLLYDTKSKMFVPVHVAYNKKTKTLSLSSPGTKQKTLQRNMKWEKLERGDRITLVLPYYKMKLQTQLARTKDQFLLFLNGEDVYSLKRYERKYDSEDSDDGEGD